MSLTSDEPEQSSETKAWIYAGNAINSHTNETRSMQWFTLTVMSSMLAAVLATNILLLVYTIRSDSRAEERHAESMKTVQMIQQVRVEQRNGSHEGLVERVLRGEFNGNVRRVDGANQPPAGVDNSK